MKSKAALTAPDFPVLRSLETYRGTRWGRLQPHLNSIADVALAPATRRLNVGELGGLAWMPYSAVPSRRPELPCWCEGITPLFPQPVRAGDGVPVGLLLTRDPERPTAMTARLVAIPRDHLPFTSAAQVVVDINDGDEDRIALADLYRATASLPTTAELTAAQLLAAETRIVCVDDEAWVRSHHGERISVRVVDPPPFASNVKPAIEAMRSAQAHTFVERVAYEVHPDDIEYAADAGIAAVTESILRRTIATGPFIALAAIEAIASQRPAS